MGAHTSVFTDEFKDTLEVVEEQVHHEECSLRACVDSVWFEIVVASLIIVNTVVMAVEAQYHGNDTGYAMEYPGANISAVAAWPWVGNLPRIGTWPSVGRDWFIHLQTGLGATFTLEVLLRMLALRQEFLKTKCNCLDFIIISLWLVSFFEWGDSNALNLTYLRTVCLWRLIHRVRILKTTEIFDSLHVLMESIRSSLSVLLWAGTLLVLIHSAISLFFTRMLDPVMNDVHNGIVLRHKVYKHFGTWSRSFLTMFELTLGDWIPVTRMLAEDVDEWWVVFAIFYKITFGFAMLKVLTAVFLCEAIKVASSNEDMNVQNERSVRRHMKLISLVVADANLSPDEVFSRDEWKKLLGRPSMRKWLEAMDLDPSIQLFDTLHHGSGELTVEDFVRGVSRLRGPARNVDVVRLGHCVFDLASRLQYSASPLQQKS